MLNCTPNTSFYTWVVNSNTDFQLKYSVAKHVSFLCPLLANKKLWTKKETNSIVLVIFIICSVLVIHNRCLKGQSKYSVYLPLSYSKKIKKILPYRFRLETSSLLILICTSEKYTGSWSLPNFVNKVRVGQTPALVLFPDRLLSLASLCSGGDLCPKSVPVCHYKTLHPTGVGVWPRQRLCGWIWWTCQLQ